MKRIGRLQNPKGFCSLFLKPLDDFLSSVSLKINVEVRQFDVRSGEYPFKQKTVAKRINVGDAEAVCDNGTGGT